MPTAADLVAAPDSALALAGQVADAHASANLFSDYRSRRAPNTIRLLDNASPISATN